MSPDFSKMSLFRLTEFPSDYVLQSLDILQSYKVQNKCIHLSVVGELMCWIVTNNKDYLGND